MTESFGGGVLQSILELSRVQKKMGYLVSVVYLKRKGTPNQSEIQDLFGGIEVTCLGKSSLISLLKLGLTSVQIRKSRNCVMHAHSSWAGLVLRLAAIIARTQVVLYTPHSFSFERTDIRHFQRYIFFSVEWCLSRTKQSRILGCSHRETEIGLKISNGRADFLGNYCESFAKRYSQHYSKKNTNAGKLRIFGAGRICIQKNPVRFANVAKNSESDCEFIWVGGGDNPDYFKDSGVRITGWINRDKLAEHFISSDVFLLTSDWEGLPFTVIEALSCSKPIVAFRIEGIEEYVLDGFNGFIVESIQEATNKIVQLKNDPNLLATLSTNSGNFFEQNFSLSILEKTWEKVYGIVNAI
jgi:glycosyltransferase involved in cell wall biosynthesis